MNRKRFFGKTKTRMFLFGMAALAGLMVWTGCEQPTSATKNTGKDDTREVTRPEELESALSDPAVKEIDITDNIDGSELTVEVKGNKTIYIPGGKETDISSLTLAEGSHVTIRNAIEKTVNGGQSVRAALSIDWADAGWATLVIWNHFMIPDGATFELIGKVRLIFRSTVGTVQVDGELKAEEGGNIAAEEGGTAPTITGSGTVTVDGDTKKEADTDWDVDVTPTMAVTGVNMDPETLTLAVNGTAKLNATVEPTNASNKAVIWSSGDSAKVAVDENGTVTGKAITGTDPVTITVTTEDGEFAATCEVTVKTLYNITVSGTHKTTYNQYETLDLTGLVVTATFTDASTDEVTGWTASPDDGDTLDTAGSQTVTITYAGETDTFDITVNALQSIAVTAQPDKTTYIQGETLDLTGLVVTATFNGGTKTVSDWTTTNPPDGWAVTPAHGTSLTTVGQNQTVTISYGGQTATCAVTVTLPVAGDRNVHTLDAINIPFRYVPDGRFQRDSTSGNNTSITKGYWMGETEVTQQLFQAVMKTNPSYFDGTAGGSPYAKDTPTGETQNQRPVEQVSWYAVIAFCNKLSLLNGKDPVYSVRGVTDWRNLAYNAIPKGSNADWSAATMDTTKNGYRLPTEAEWMWAAMGADKTSQPNTTGYSKAFAGTGAIGGNAWYSVNANSKTHQVGKKYANELGIHDMSGNVYEWCWDGYNDSVGTGELTDPVGSGTDRVIRGGGWYYDASESTVARRRNGPPNGRNLDIGFRVVCSAVTP